MPNLLLFADDAIRLAAVSYEPGNQDQFADLDNYGSGLSYVRADHTMRRNGFANNWRALHSSTYAFFGGVPQIAFSAARMNRGEVLPTIASQAVGIASFPGLSSVLAPVARFFLPPLGAAGAATISPLLAIIPAYGLGKAAAASVRWFGQFGYRQRRAELGGTYNDTDTAYDLRMRAVSEMSSAMSYSRRWLGNEALFMR